MANTIPSLKLSDTWIDVYAATGIQIGTAINIENIGSETAELHVSDTKPVERPVNVGANSLYPLETKTLKSGNLGLWARNKADLKNALIQVDVAGGLSSAEFEQAPSNPTLQIKLSATVQAANTVGYALIRNNTDSAILLNQIFNFNSSPTGNGEGSSAITHKWFFNPDLTGTSEGTSFGAAYSSLSTGQFLDLTNTAVNITPLTGFDELLNPNNLTMVSGLVTYFSSAQSEAVDSINQTVSIINPLFIAPAGIIVVSFENVGLIGGGTESVSGLNMSGRFFNEPITILPPPTADFDSDFTNDFA